MTEIIINKPRDYEKTLNVAESPIIPKNGYAARGMRAVIAIGIVSVAQYNAIIMTTPSTLPAMILPTNQNMELSLEKSSCLQSVTEPHPVYLRKKPTIDFDERAHNECHKTKKQYEIALPVLPEEVTIRDLNDVFGEGFSRDSVERSLNQKIAKNEYGDFNMSDTYHVHFLMLLQAPYRQY
tara:strand:- start:956 stop:1498 length:543 start_codon:yes stop_codon:yes gene_type:complete